MDKSFRAIMAEIACDMSEKNVKGLQIVLLDMDPDCPTHKCKTALELFDELEQRRLITPEDPTRLKKALEWIGRSDLSERLPDPTRNASHGIEEVSQMGYLKLYKVVDKLRPEDVQNLKYIFKVPQGTELVEGIDLAWHLIFNDNVKDLPTELKNIKRIDLAKLLKEEEEPTHTYNLRNGLTSINRDNLEKMKEEKKNTTYELKAATRFLAKCTKNPGHENFIPVVEFTSHDLPLEWQREDFTKYIRVWSDLTVRLRVRGSTGAKTGTGFVAKLEPINKPGHGFSPMSWNVHIGTSKRVVEDDAEAKNMRVDFFYDSVESLIECRMKSLKGGIVVETHDARDSCVLSCVSHDNELASFIMYQIYQREKLKHKLDEWLFSLSPRPVVIVSHPHGGLKQVTVGELRDVDPDSGTCTYTTDTCPGSSGAYVVGMFGWKRNPFTTSSAHHSMSGSWRDGTNQGFFE